MHKSSNTPCFSILLGFHSSQTYHVCTTAPVQVVLHFVKIQVLMIGVSKHSSTFNPLAYFSVFNFLVHQHLVVNPSLWWPVNAGYRHYQTQTCSQSVVHSDLTRLMHRLCRNSPPALIPPVILCSLLPIIGNSDVTARLGWLTVRLRHLADQKWL